MMSGRSWAIVVIIAGLGFSATVAAEQKQEKYREYEKEKNFDEMTQAEHTAAKRYAKTADIRPLIACADPGNMPLSSMDGEGIDNRIIKLLAEAMDTQVSFFWRPYLERGLTRDTFDYRQCDILLGMPHDYASILTTIPIYRSTYVFAYREDSNIKIDDLDDSDLESLSIGVYQHSGLREALARHGIKHVEIHVIRQNTDLVPENQQWRQVQKVADGKLDVAGVWGPFAGYVKAKKDAPLVLQPVNMMEDRTPLEFSLAIGMRKNDVVLKYAMDNALQEKAAEIETILREFRVPLVSCSDCVIQGDLPSHGSYYERFMEAARERYLQPPDIIKLDESLASSDQIVKRERLRKWLEEGADVNAELANAVTASDPERVRFLVEQGAEIDRLNDQGYGVMHNAARYRDSTMIDLLIDLGADVDLRDSDKWTPLMHAAFRNHVPSVECLIEAGADIEAKTPEQFNTLGIALGEHKFWAAKTLVEAGAKVNGPVAEEGLTPLMLVATHLKSKARDTYIAEGIEPVEMARLLIDKGADVNANTPAGITPLMVAAAYDNSPIIGLLIQKNADISAKSDNGKTALDIARENRSTSAIKSLELFSRFDPDGNSPDASSGDRS